MADEILRERRGHVEILTINRPEARNAINRATAVALGDALDDCERDDDVWVVVLTAAGDKAFSAGMDLKAFVAGESAWVGDRGFAGIACHSDYSGLPRVTRGGYSPPLKERT